MYYVLPLKDFTKRKAFWMFSVGKKRNVSLVVVKA